MRDVLTNRFWRNSLMFVTNNPRHFMIYAAVALAVTVLMVLFITHSTNSQIDRTTNAVEHQIDKVVEANGPPRTSDKVRLFGECLSAAGSDASAVRACQLKFG